MSTTTTIHVFGGGSPGQDFDLPYEDECCPAPDGTVFDDSWRGRVEAVHHFTARRLLEAGRVRWQCMACGYATEPDPVAH